MGTSKRAATAPLFSLREAKILYALVRDVFKENIGARATPTVVWWDTQREIAEYFKDLRSDSLVNRIPNSMCMCRKLPFVLLIQRMQKMFPDEYSFIPQSFVLPAQQRDFEEARKRSQRFIIKPDTGSVGYHIDVLKADDPLPERVANGYVGQEYLESIPHSVGGQLRKFDFRLYVVVTKLDPLTIHMSIDGLTRVCAAQYGLDSPCAQLTNTAINKDVEGVRYADITLPFSPVLEKLERELKQQKARNQAVREEFGRETLMNKIEDLIVRTVIAALPEMRRGCRELIPEWQNSLRCFQIFGFDILIGQNFKPYVLEVNYRPSLKWGMDEEERIKKKVLQEAVYIAVCQKTGVNPTLSRFWQICPHSKYGEEIERSCHPAATFDDLLTELVKAPPQKPFP